MRVNNSTYSGFLNECIVLPYILLKYDYLPNIFQAMKIFQTGIKKRAFLVSG